MVPAALALYVGFLVLAFGWRTWVRYHRDGDTGYRGFSGDSGWLERVAGILFVASIIVCVASSGAIILGTLSPEIVGNGLGSGLAGLLLVGAGAGLALTAQVQMGSAWRVGVDPEEPLALVRSGLFKYARNPFFTGLLLSTVGLVIVGPTRCGVAALIMLLVAVELQVRRVEEPYLRRVRGAEYAEYAGEVGRFLPGLGKIR